MSAILLIWSVFVPGIICVFGICGLEFDVRFPVSPFLAIVGIYFPLRVRILRFACFDRFAFSVSAPALRVRFRNFYVFDPPMWGFRYVLHKAPPLVLLVFCDRCFNAQ